MFRYILVLIFINALIQQSFAIPPKGICRIYLKNAGEPGILAIASGSLVGNRLITCRHCLEGLEIAEVTCTGDIKVDLKDYIVKKSINRDLGVVILNKDYDTDIEVPDSKAEYKKLEEAKDFKSFGYGTRNDQNELTEVVVGGIKEHSGNYQGMTQSEFITPSSQQQKLVHGDSGGPLLTKVEDKYYLLGINTGIARDNDLYTSVRYNLDYIFDGADLTPIEVNNEEWVKRTVQLLKDNNYDSSASLEYLKKFKYKHQFDSVRYIINAEAQVSPKLKHVLDFDNPISAEAMNIAASYGYDFKHSMPHFKDINTVKKFEILEMLLDKNIQLADTIEYIGKLNDPIIADAVKIELSKFYKVDGQSTALQGLFNVRTQRDLNSVLAKALANNRQRETSANEFIRDVKRITENVNRIKAKYKSPEKIINRGLYYDAILSSDDSWFLNGNEPIEKYISFLKEQGLNSEDLKFLMKLQKYEKDGEIAKSFKAYLDDIVYEEEKVEFKSSLKNAKTDDEFLKLKKKFCHNQKFCSEILQKGLTSSKSHEGTLSLLKDLDPDLINQNQKIIQVKFESLPEIDLKTIEEYRNVLNNEQYIEEKVKGYFEKNGPKILQELKSTNSMSEYLELLAPYISNRKSISHRKFLDLLIDNSLNHIDNLPHDLEAMKSLKKDFAYSLNTDLNIMASAQKSFNLSLEEKIQLIQQDFDRGWPKEVKSEVMTKLVDQIKNILSTPGKTIKDLNNLRKKFISSQELDLIFIREGLSKVTTKDELFKWLRFKSDSPYSSTKDTMNKFIVENKKFIMDKVTTLDDLEYLLSNLASDAETRINLLDIAIDKELITNADELMKFTNQHFFAYSSSKDRLGKYLLDNVEKILKLNPSLSQTRKLILESMTGHKNFQPYLEHGLKSVQNIDDLHSLTELHGTYLGENVKNNLTKFVNKNLDYIKNLPGSSKKLYSISTKLNSYEDMEKIVNLALERAPNFSVAQDLLKSSSEFSKYGNYPLVGNLIQNNLEKLYSLSSSSGQLEGFLSQYNSPEKAKSQVNKFPLKKGFISRKLECLLNALRE